MDKQLFEYITNEKEESALNSLCSYLKHDKEFFFNTVSFFLDSKKYFIDTENDYVAIDGFGNIKLLNLRNVYHRVVNNLEVNVVGYFSNHQYSLTHRRYDSLSGRNFDRLIFEKLHINKLKMLSNMNQINTKRIYSRGATMEVDKRDPQKGYQLDNLSMSCYWCNNAKTDEFDEKEFGPIARQIGLIWKKRLNEAA